MSKLTPPVSSGDQALGNRNASMILVEFGDYQCPHCGYAHPLIKRLLDEKGKDFLFVFRNFPLQEVHPNAYGAALAAEAAGLQGKFWQMHDVIFENQEKLNSENLLAFAKMLGLDANRFLTDMQNPAIAKKIDSDFESGIRSGVNGTPTFYLNGSKMFYDTSYESLFNAVNLYKKD